MPRTPAAPMDEADAVRQTLVNEHAARNSVTPTVPVANGIRMPVNVAIEPRYAGMDTTQMLGAPESILKTARPGHKYLWKKRTDKQTAAWIRAGILRPILPDEVDTSNPIAEYVEDILPGGGSCVSWESLALFEMSPKWVKKIYEAPEEWALKRMAAASGEFAGKVNDATGGAYQGSVNVTK